MDIGVGAALRNFSLRDGADRSRVRCLDSLDLRSFWIAWKGGPNGNQPKLSEQCQFQANKLSKITETRKVKGQTQKVKGIPKKRTPHLFVHPFVGPKPPARNVPACTEPKLSGAGPASSQLVAPKTLGGFHSQGCSEPRDGELSKGRG